MNIKVHKILFLLLIPLALSNCYAGGEKMSVEQRLERLEAAMMQMAQEKQQLAEELKTVRSELQSLKTANASQQVVATDAELQEKIKIIVNEQVKTETAKMPQIPEWVSKTKFSGDFRYRYEYTDNQANGRKQNRNRIRTRLFLQSQVNDEFDLGFRLASGNTESPTGTNQDMEGAFSKKNVWLDLAYFRYRPQKYPSLTVTGGKIKNPYKFPGSSDLIFDLDVNPEGLAVLLTNNLNDWIRLDSTAGTFWVEERTSDADTSLWAVQTAATFMFDTQNDLELTLGAGYFDYGNTKGKVALGSNNTKFYGNTAVGGKYANDYDIFEGYNQLTWQYGGRPVTLYSDYIKNISATTNDDTGYLFGIDYGKRTKPGSWKVGYNYRRLEADAAVAYFTDATIAGGGTNLRGHKFSFQYQIDKNIWTSFGVYLADKDLKNEKGHNVFTADLSFKF